jgi:hypothetical protein
VVREHGSQFNGHGPEEVRKMTVREATKRQASKINYRIDEINSDYESGTVRIMHDGMVTVIADPMPNTNERGRIFVGWDTDIMRELDIAGND